MITTSMVSHDEYIYIYVIYKQCIIDSYNICNYIDIIRYIYIYIYILYALNQSFYKIPPSPYQFISIPKVT